jgi:hypothetical protein
MQIEQVVAAPMVYGSRASENNGYTRSLPRTRRRITSSLRAHSSNSTLVTVEGAMWIRPLYGLYGSAPNHGVRQRAATSYEEKLEAM